MQDFGKLLQQSVESYFGLTFPVQFDGSKGFNINIVFYKIATFKQTL